MYQRQFSDGGKRRRRGAGRLSLPAAAFLLAVAAFTLSFTLEPASGASPGPAQQSLPTRSLSSLPDLGGEEPPVPSRAPDQADWRLTLVNPWHSLPEDYDPPVLTELSGGHAVDKRCYPDLQEMMDDCRAAGNSPLICSSYRSQEKQESLYQNKVNRLRAQGYSPEKAKAEAAKSVALPGTSEHQLGLAVDIVDVNNQNLDKSQENTAVQKWLMEHSWEYGFILRYPGDKSETTGIIYEPWHYRYVGKEAAGEIHKQGICLEEYLEALDT